MSGNRGASLIVSDRQAQGVAMGQRAQTMRSLGKVFIDLVQIKISFLFLLVMSRIAPWLIAAEFAGDPSADSCRHHKSESECLARWVRYDENSCGKRVAR